MGRAVQRGQRGFLRYIIVLPLLAGMMLWGWSRFEHHSYELHHKQARDKVFHEMIDIMERLESSLSRRLFIVLSVESSVYSRGGITADEFEPLAENLWRYSGKGLKSLQVTVGTRIQHVYPLQGNESVVGLDLLSIKGQAETVRRTIKERKMVVAGPYNLVQGGRAVIARKPIYLNSDAGGGYWGMATIIIDWETLLAESGIADASDLAISLRGLDATGIEGAFFYGGEEEYAGAITLPVTLPNGEWILSGRPRDGWPDISVEMVQERSVFFLLFTLIMGMAIFAMRYPRILERRVYEATRELKASHDLLERRVKERTAALQESEKRMRQLFDALPFPIIVTAVATGKYLYANDRTAALFWESKEDRGQVARDYYQNPDDREKLLEMLRRNGALSNVEVGMINGKGRLFWSLVSAVKIEFDGHDAILSAHTDISERKAIEQALKQANLDAAEAIKAKNEFLATMSHEIRTPLNGALSMVKLLGQTQLDAQQRDYLNAIDFSGESLLQILSDVLDLSKLEAGKLELEQSNFDLRKMIDEMVGLMQVQCDPPAVQLSATLDSRIPSQLYGDATRLRQVLFNLLGNALKFTERGEVELRANFISERMGKIGIEFSVRDTGIGIAEEVQPRLFGDFTQADSSMARRFGGSGLGLAICKRMVGLMGGEIGVESELGKGSRFWFRLEMQRGRAPQDSLDGEAEVILPFDALRVLLVEDDAINRLAGSELLRQQGCEVTTAADGYEALERFHDGHFDVVLMDVRMPGMDGLETTQRLREIEPHGATVPVIALTADVTQENIDRCHAVGMQEVLSKPIHMDRLSRVLAVVRVHDGANDCQMINGEEKPTSGPD